MTWIQSHRGVACVEEWSRWRMVFVVELMEGIGQGWGMGRVFGLGKGNQGWKR
jgi:hypothetical protein